jgi:hypothetical protein
LQEFEDQYNTLGQTFHLNPASTLLHTEDVILVQTAKETQTTFSWYATSSDEEDSIISHIVQRHDIYDHQSASEENMPILPPRMVNGSESDSQTV